MSGSKWILEVYLVLSVSENPVITLEFDDLPQLRLALTNIPDHKYIVEIPASASAADRIALLDLRAQSAAMPVGSLMKPMTGNLPFATGLCPLGTVWGVSSLRDDNGIV